MRQLWYLLVAEWGQKERVRIDGSRMRGVRIVLAMPTLTQARKVHFGASPGVLDELEGDWAFLGGRLNSTTWRINFPEYKSWVQFVTTDNQIASRGIRADVACFDEADDIEESFYTAVAGPWFSEPHSLNMTLVAGTPKRGRRGFLWTAHHDWPEKLPGKAYSFHATAYDTKHVSRERLEEDRVTTPEEIFKREWLCDFDATEGVVYTEFSERFHVRTPPATTRFTGYLVGGDHGLQDPSVLLLIGIEGSGRDVTAWVLDEIYERGRGPIWWQQAATKLISRFPHALWYCDPAGYGDSANALYHAAGAKMRTVVKDAGSVERGIGVLKRWLKIQTRRRQGDALVPDDEFARLYVHPRCKNLIREFGLYRHKRDPRDTNIVLEDIVPGSDHALDALRYAITNHFPDSLVSYGLANLAPG